MSKQFYPCGLRNDNNERELVPDEKLAEMEHALLRMLKNGLPPEQILERIAEHYAKPDASYEESKLKEASEAFRVFMDKYQTAQRAVSKEVDDPSNSCDSLKIVLSPSSGRNSRPHSTGFSRPQSKGCSRPQSTGCSRPQSTGFRDLYENQLDVDNSFGSIQQSRGEDQPFFLVRPVSRDELRAAILQPGPQESTTLFHPQQFNEQITPQIDLEPIKETSRMKDPMTGNAVVSPNIEIEEDRFLVAKFLPPAQIRVPDYDAGQEGIAEVANRGSPDESEEHELKPNTTTETKKARIEHKSKNALPTPQMKPPPESTLAGGEGTIGIRPLRISSDIRELTSPSPDTRSCHRTAQAAARNSVPRKRITVTKKKENNLAKSLVSAASILGFIAVGGYVIYKNKYVAMFNR